MQIFLTAITRAELTFLQQMANIGSETSRVLNVLEA